VCVIPLGDTRRSPVGQPTGALSADRASLASPGWSGLRHEGVWLIPIDALLDALR
jgi:hypothetical protein